MKFGVTISLLTLYRHCFIQYLVLLSVAEKFLVSIFFYFKNLFLLSLNAYRQFFFFFTFSYLRKLAKIGLMVNILKCFYSLHIFLSFLILFHLLCGIINTSVSWIYDICSLSFFCSLKLVSHYSFDDLQYQFCMLLLLLGVLILLLYFYFS